MKIRKAVIGDDVSSLILAASSCVFEWYQLDVEDCFNYLYKSSNNKFSYENCYVLEKHGIIIGAFLIYHQSCEALLAKNQEKLLRDKYLVSVKVDDQEGLVNSYYLDSIAILEEFRGVGYGNYLFEFILSEFKIVSLLVLVDNLGAFNFYEKIGFKVVEEITIFGEKFYKMLY